MFSLTLLAALGAASLYPDGHFDHVTKLTTDNFDDWIKTSVDSGQTAFAPAWDEVTGIFQSNSKVTFGDVNLSDESIRNGPDGGSLDTGAGGWPTVRYFNKETGYDGAPYEKKTDKAMCDELGDIEYMQAYVEEAGGASLCSIEETDGCSEKQTKYIKKFSQKSAEDLQKQITRLKGMTDKKMKPELMKWVKQRLAILEQFSAKDSIKDEL